MFHWKLKMLFIIGAFSFFPIITVRRTIWTGGATLIRVIKKRRATCPTRETRGPATTSLIRQRWFLFQYLLAGIFILALTGAQIWLKRVWHQVPHVCMYHSTAVLLFQNNAQRMTERCGVAPDRVTLGRNDVWTFDRSDLLAVLYLATGIRICNSELRIRISAIRQRFKEI